ncbi:hypothetical protein [Sedimentibacter saalensis]|nr:hypothetical protein [Sedimentibacter saalensis]MEA5093669.1 hypothetical protein [Sedimentibacter saalensis]
MEEVDGVKFVIESDLEVGIGSPEIIKTGDNFKINRKSCGC